MHRINHVNILIGRRGEGKTYYLQHEVLPHTSQKKILICDTYNHPAYNEYEDLHLSNFEKWAKIKTKSTVHLFGSDFKPIFNTINTYAENMLIVFEDATKYIEQKVPEPVKNFILDTKQKNIDLIFLFHSFKDVPPKLFSWSDSITFFRTNENIFNQKNRLPCYDAIIDDYIKLKYDSDEKYIKPITVLIN